MAQDLQLQFGLNDDWKSKVKYHKNIIPYIHLVHMYSTIQYVIGC